MKLYRLTGKEDYLKELTYLLGRLVACDTSWSQYKHEYLYPLSFSLILSKYLLINN